MPRLLFLLAFCLSLSLAGCNRAPAPPPFDVPALIGQPIDAVTQRLGAPTAQSAGERSWTREGTTLSAQFRPNGRVTALTLTSREADRAVREGEQEKLLQPGRLPANAPGYSLEWIEAPERPLFYTGVKITPAPRNYKVELRLSGGSAMVEASYALGGPAPQAETFLTIAPWNLEATLPDDATIQFQSRLYKKRMPGAAPMKVEILVDGKVVASQDSQGRKVACAYEL